METFRIGPVLRRSLNISLRNVVPFGVIGLLIYAPYIVFSLQDAPAGTQPEPTWDFRILTHVLEQLLVGAIAYGVAQDHKGDRPRLLKCLHVALAHMFSIVSVGLIPGIALLAVTIQPLFLVPGLVITTLLYVAIPAAVLEQRGVMHSLRRSAVLTLGRRWKILGLWILIVLMLLMGAQILDVLFAPEEDNLDTAYVAGLLVLQVSFGVFSAVVAGVSYFELRRTRYGDGPEHRRFDGMSSGNFEEKA